MPKVTKSLNVLFVGNSYTNRNDLPGLFERLAAAGTPPARITTQRVIANGMSLKTHWDRGVAAALISQQRWDYVILQDQSTMPLKNPARLKEYAAKFDELCRAKKAKTALYLTWARQDAPNRQAEITAAYETAGRDIGATVVPVGVAWESTLHRFPAITLHDKDKSHPSAAGSYLAACVFYGMLLSKSPIGLPAEGLAPNDAMSLQVSAWDACSAPAQRSSAGK